MKVTQHTQLEQLFLQGQEQKYKKHQTILSPEKTQEHVYYVQKGHIAVYSSQTPKNTRMIALLKPKNFFPILNTLTQDKRLSRFIALDEVRLYTIPTKQFSQATKDPQYAQDIIASLANLLSIFIDRVDNLEMAKANTRLIGRILFFAKHYGTQRGKQIIINIPMTHAIIASSIAATRETVTRELIKLEKKGIIEYENQKITINSLPKLEEELIQTLA
jgi:CRP-like cAMP-binding protein